MLKNQPQDANNAQPGDNDNDDVVSVFRDQAYERRAQQHALVADDAAAAGDYDQKPWGLLYSALINSLGVTPDTFQLVYPYTKWNWATAQAGYIGSAQYDFCSTVPQWSAVGSYVSSGDRFNDAYQQFLNVILAATDDPKLRQQIRDADQQVTKASNDYDTIYRQAETSYGDKVKDNDPSFSDWLGSAAGKGWATKLATAETKLLQTQKTYNALVAKANTPGLADAQKQFANEDFYARLESAALQNFPKVPYWAVAQDSAEWVDAVLAGEGPAGATMGFTARDSSYDYKKTWAGGSASVRQWFWEVQVAGKWERVTQFESDSQLEVSLEFEAIDQIQIQPSGWYNGPVVRSLSKGPYTTGYSEFGGGGTKAVFGEKGFFTLLKTGMIVGFKPSFSIRTSKSTFDSFKQKFSAATGLRIGPFVFEAAGGSEQAGWNASASGNSFTGTTTSNQALIIGVSISKLP